MKGKLFALISLAAGVGIVGTTFAAWAVTDNADPFSIKVTPGGSGTDDTKTVTLAYGSTFHANNISGLTAEAPKMAAEVGLLATTAGDNYTGKFSLQLEDLTESKPVGNAKLIEHLGVKVYSKENIVISYDSSTKAVSTDLSGETPDCYIPIEGEDPYSTSITYEVASGTEHVVYVVVSLESGLSPSVLDQIHDDYVRITMDWGKGSAADQESSEIYYKATTLTGDNHYYVYAWDASGNKNHEWPGVAMDEVYEVVSGTSLYSYNLGTQFVNVIFNDGQSGEGHQSADQSITSTIRETTPCFNGSSWEAKPAQSGLTADWYVVGSYSGGSWDPAAAGAMTFVDNGDDDYYKLEGVVLAANDKIKVCNAAKDQWRTSEEYFGGETIKAHKDGDGNIVVEEAGTYNIRMYPSGSNGNYVILSKA